MSDHEHVFDNDRKRLEPLGEKAVDRILTDDQNRLRKLVKESVFTGEDAEAFLHSLNPQLRPPTEGLKRMIDKAKNVGPVQVLHECIGIQERKSMDYQNPNSNVKQADYYPSGIKTIYEIVLAKTLRMKSLIEQYELNADVQPKNESIEDSAMDAINYLSFLVAYIRGEIAGQDTSRDILNRKRPYKELVCKSDKVNPS
jgi:hypothetical protein